MVDCEVCSQPIEDGQDTVNCEGICERKFHISCVGINTDTAILVDSSINVSFVCTNCAVLTPKGLNASIKELNTLFKSKDAQFQQFTNEMLEKQDSLNSLVKLYMKDILADVKMNKHSLGKLTIAMKTLFESSHKDKGTLGNITSNLNENHTKIEAMSKTVGKIEEQTSNYCFEEHLKNVNLTMESMAEVTTNMIEMGLERHHHITSELNSKFKSKIKKIKSYKKVINELTQLHKETYSKNDKKRRKKINKISLQKPGMQDEVHKVVQSKKSKIIEQIPREMEISFNLEEIRVCDTNTHSINEICVTNKNDSLETLKARNYEIRKETELQEKKKSSKGIIILENIQLSKLDASINKQIYDYNQSVRRSNQAFSQRKVSLYKFNRVEVSAEHTKNKRREKSIMIKPKMNQDFRKTKQDLENKFNPCDFEIESVKSISHGGVVILCRTREAKETLVRQAQVVLGDEYNIINQSVSNPRIKIFGISLKSDDICNSIIQQNDFINEKAIMKIIKIEDWKKHHKEFNTYDAIIETDGDTHRDMLNKGKVYVGWNRCWITDAVELRRCFNCSGYNHVAEKCKNSTHCPKCAGDHRLKDCNELRNKCINCFYANQNSTANLDENHSALDRNCEVYQRKLSVKRKNVSYIQ